MKFGTVTVDGDEVPVVRMGEGPVVRLSALMSASGGRDAGSWRTLHDFIGLGEAKVEAVRSALASGSLPEGAVVAEPRFLAPIPRPAKNVFCVGRNYLEHIAEDNAARSLNTERPKYPQFFTKPPTAVVGPDAAIILNDRVTRRLDYEVELAVVIGKQGRDIAPEHVHDHIFGYTICNDISARDLQRRHDQWFKGKALDTTCPLGPMIVHKSALGDPQALTIGLSVNGAQRQRASTADMIFSINELVSSLSAGLTLEPGDVIATGTPAGVGYTLDPPSYLQAGDVVSCWIEGIGTLENRIVAA